MKDFKRIRSPDTPSHWLRLRVQLVGLAFFGLLAICLGRAVQLQVFERGKLRDLAEDQYVRNVEIPARRGDIFDRRGIPLAQSVQVDSIWIDPGANSDLRGAARLLAKKLKLSFEELLGRFSRAKRFAWVKRQVRPEEVNAVRAAEIPGIGFAKEPRRFYPQRELAAQVLGLVGTEGHGLDGLELAFEDELSGEKSALVGLRDARGRKLLTQGAEDPAAHGGAALTLTLDRQLQYVTEKALAKAVDESKALSGMAVMENPKTGEILALANYPRFNPNAPMETAKQALKNRAALDTFEPGSTFKAFVVAAGLEEQAFGPDQLFDCENGRFLIGRKAIHDTHRHGLLTPGQILQVSSNIGAAKMAEALGREKLVQYYGRFGFGEKAGLALPGEGKGSVPFPKADISLATQSFGQGVTATAVQIAAAYSALANGGVLMHPYLVSRVTDADGTVLLENRPSPARRVVSEDTARQVVSMLEGVVAKDGTAPKARVPGYRVAGKTGTAQKVDPVGHGYSDKRIASFVGMIPAEDPRLVILIVVDEPKTDTYGGLVAAPAFREIAEAAMPYLAIPPSLPLMAASKDSGRPAPPPPSRPSEEAPSLEPVEAVVVPPGRVQVPDVQGKGGREAVFSVLSASLEPRLLGSGRVVSQIPAPGVQVEKGTKVMLELATRP